MPGPLLFFNFSMGEPGNEAINDSIYGIVKLQNQNISKKITLSWVHKLPANKIEGPISPPSAI